MLKIINKIQVMFLIFILSGCNSGGDSALHRPYYNPGGIDFQKDKEFFKSYQKLSSLRKQRCKNSKLIDRNEEDLAVHENGLIPGSILIETQSTKRGDNLLNKILMKIKSRKDKNWFKENCVENKDLPNDIKLLISERCTAIIKENKIDIDSNKDKPLNEQSGDLEFMGIDKSTQEISDSTSKIDTEYLTNKRKEDRKGLSKKRNTKDKFNRKSIFDRFKKSKKNDKKPAISETFKLTESGEQEKVMIEILDENKITKGKSNKKIKTNKRIIKQKKIKPERQANNKKCKRTFFKRKPNRDIIKVDELNPIVEDEELKLETKEKVVKEVVFKEEEQKPVFENTNSVIKEVKNDNENIKRRNKNLVTKRKAKDAEYNYPEKGCLEYDVLSTKRDRCRRVK